MYYVNVLDANVGTYSVCPFTVGNVHGISTLWREYDGSMTSSTNTNTNATKNATLGIYRDIPNAQLFPGGLLSGKKMSTHKTLHKIVEILPASDNKIEQSLLKNKSFVVYYY